MNLELALKKKNPVKCPTSLSFLFGSPNPSREDWMKITGMRIARCTRISRVEVRYLN